MHDRITFEFLINKLVEYIELWDDNLIIDFGIQLKEVFKTDDKYLIFESFKNIYNNIIKFCMKIITLDDECCETFIEVLNYITNFYSN